MLRDVETPAATAYNNAKMNSAKNERLFSVSLISNVVLFKLNGAMGGGCFKFGIWR